VCASRDIVSVLSVKVFMANLHQTRVDGISRDGYELFTVCSQKVWVTVDIMCWKVALLVLISAIS